MASRRNGTVTNLHHTACNPHCLRPSAGLSPFRQTASRPKALRTEESMQDPIQIIGSYGDLFYLITFFWSFLEGETFVLFAGLAANKGLLRIDLLIAAAWIGSFCGDQAWFLLGRRFGDPLVRRFPKLRPGVDAALCWLERYDTR